MCWLDWLALASFLAFGTFAAVATGGPQAWGAEPGVAVERRSSSDAPADADADRGEVAVSKNEPKDESPSGAGPPDAKQPAAPPGRDAWTPQLERLRTLVYRRPQSTATFDRWYDLARQAGALPRLTDEVQAYRRDHPREAAAQMVAALVSEKARDWPAASEAWNAAATLAPQDYFPASRRAELLLRRQEFAAAAEALAAALQLEMPPAEFQRLARQQVALAMRGGDADATARALDAWRQRSAEDPAALREIAQRYQQIQRPDEARRTWQRLVSLRRAPADLRFDARMQLALLQARQGDPLAARQDLRTLLQEVEPQGTRADQLRQAIHATFARTPATAAPAGGATEEPTATAVADARADFWKAYSDEHPSDLETRIAWADALADAGRVDAALDACRASLLRAPNHRTLRERIVKLLIQRGDYDAAVGELKSLADQAGDDWSLLVEAGKLRLHRDELEDESAQQAAIELWRQAVDRFPRDPLVARAVADASQEAALGDLPAAWDGRPRDAYPEDLRRRRTLLWQTAEAQYREAARRDPSADHARQVARLLHRLGRAEEAVEAWRQAASAAPESADRWLETSSELARAGYIQPALEAAEKATLVDDSSTQAWTRWLELCVAHQQLDRAEAALAKMRTVRPSDPAWQMEVRQWQARLAVVAQRAPLRLEQLDRQLRATQDPAAPRDAHWIDAAWEWLLLREATGQLQADDAVLGQLAALPFESPQERLRLAVLMQEAHRLDEATRLYEEAVAQRGGPRKETFRRWTELELRRGRPDAALAVAQRMARELPRDVESHLLLATVLGRQGDREAQAAELRTAIGFAPRDVTARRQLASLLQQEGRADEARAEVLDAVRQSSSVAEMQSLLTWLASWARSTTERDEVADALRGMITAEPRRQEDRAQALALWLEQTGDARAALQQLEMLQARQPLDAARLRKVVELARQTDEHEIAIRYQQQLLQLNPSPANRELLAQLYRQSGRLADAAAIWNELLDYRGTEEEATRLVDELIARSDLFAAQRLVEAALSRHADSWRLTYRASLVHVALGQSAAARHELLRLLQHSPGDAGRELSPPRSVAQELELLDWVVGVDMRLRMARWKRAQAGRDRERDATRYFAEELMQPLADDRADRARIAAALIGLRLLPDRMGREELRALADTAPGDEALQRAIATALWIDGDAAGTSILLHRIDTADDGGTKAAASANPAVWSRVLRVLLFGQGETLAHADALRQVGESWNWLRRHDDASAASLHALLATRTCMAPASAARDERIEALVRETTTVDSLAEWIVAIRYVAPELLEPLEPLRETLWDAASPTGSLAPPGTRVRAETAQQIVEFALQRPQPDAQSWQSFVASWLHRFWSSGLDDDAAAAGSQPAIASTLDRLRRKLREDASLEDQQREGPALGLAGMADGSPFLDRDAVTDLRRLLTPPGPDWQEIEAHRTLRARPRAAPAVRDRTRFPTADRLWNEQGLGLLERIAAAFPEVADGEGVSARAAFEQRLQQTWRDDAAAGDADEAARNAALQSALACLQWWWDDRPRAVTRLEKLVQQEPTLVEGRLALARAYLNAEQLEAAYHLLSDTPESWRAAGEIASGEIARDVSELTQAVWTKWSEQLHLRDLLGHAGAVTALAADPRGERLASVGVDGIVRIWDPANGALLHALEGHEDMLMAVACGHDGRWIATAGYDRVVRRWDVTSGRQLAALEAHTAVVRALAIAPDGQRLASAGDDGQVLLWNVESGQVAARLPVEATVQALTYADEGRQLVALLADGQLVTWAAEGLQQPADNSQSQAPERWSSGVQPARALAAIAPQTMAIAGENGRIVVAGRPSAQEKWQEAFALLSASPVRGLAYSGSSATLSVGSEDQLVHVWDIDRRKEALVLKGHTGRILAVATPADGRWLASSGFDGAIKIWRLREAGGSSGAEASPGIEGSPDTDVSSEAPNP